MKHDMVCCSVRSVETIRQVSILLETYLYCLAYPSTFPGVSVRLLTASIVLIVFENDQHFCRNAPLSLVSKDLGTIE